MSRPLQMHRRVDRLSRFVLPAILVLGALLRFWGLSFGLPNTEVRPDETALISLALPMTYSGFNPHFFHWPTLQIYMLAAVYRVHYSIGRNVLHTFHQNFDMMRDAAANPQFYVLVPRIISATAGTATILIIYRLTRDLFDRATALIAAFFLATAFLHVRDSHFGLLDVPMTFLVCLAMIPLRDVFENGALTRKWIVAGVLCGLAASTKYNGGVAVAVGGVVAAMQAVTQPEQRRAALCGALAFFAAALVAFLAGTPYAVLDAPSFIEGVRFNSHHLLSGHGTDLGRGWSHHLRFSLWYGLGGPILVAAVAGIIVMAVVARRKGAFVATFPVIYYLLIGPGHTVFARYTIPMIPFLCIAGAYTVRSMAHLLTRWATPAHRPAEFACAAVLGIVLALPSLQRDIGWLGIIAQPDTRVLAKKWLDAQRRSSEWIVEEPTGSLYPAFVMPPPIRTARFDEGRHAFTSEAGELVNPTWVVVPKAPFAAYMARPNRIAQLVETMGYELAAVFPSGINTQPAEHFDQQDMYFVPYAYFNGQQRSGPDIYIYRARQSDYK